MYDPARTVKTEDNKKENDDFQDSDVEEPDDIKLRQKYGKESKYHYLITSKGVTKQKLPNIVELDSPYPREPQIPKKEKKSKSSQILQR